MKSHSNGTLTLYSCSDGGICLRLAVILYVETYIYRHVDGDQRKRRAENSIYYRTNIVYKVMFVLLYSIILGFYLAYYLLY